MKLALPLTFAIVFGFSGCDRIIDADHNPPQEPSGMWTETGDNFIEVFWADNPENDVAGYNVFVSSSYNGRYELIGSARTPYFLDEGAQNGSTYYYAVTAFDYEGNESDLSRDVVYDIPRPEGYNVILNDRYQLPGYAGYDFSEYTVRSYSDLYTDMFFEYSNGQYLMRVRSDSDIQDLGPTGSVLEIKRAPTSGWSASHAVSLVVGHTYVVWTWDDHYAKFRVSGLSPNRVVFDWVYQLQESNPMLKGVSGGGVARRTVHSDRLQ
ncbi:MAG: Fibronectin type-III protein [Bacteroidetes bacterium]|nr:Fibronectin type-III protein [Bacteroidota bacterium]